MNPHSHPALDSQSSSRRPTLGPCVAGALVTGPVLLAAVDEVGDLVVHVHVVHLGDGELDALPGLPAVEGEVRAPVVADHHPVGHEGIGPHVVGVSAPPGPFGGVAAVVGDAVAVGGEVDLVLVGGVHQDAAGVVGPLVQEPVVAHQRPVVATVAGPPQDPAVGPSGLDHGVDHVGITVGEGDADLADGILRAARGPRSFSQVAPESVDR